MYSTENSWENYFLNPKKVRLTFLSFLFLNLLLAGKLSLVPYMAFPLVLGLNSVNSRINDDFVPR
jgi:hypothetical protein